MFPKLLEGSGLTSKVFDTIICCIYLGFWKVCVCTNWFSMGLDETKTGGGKAADNFAKFLRP